MTAKELYSQIVTDITSFDNPNYSPPFDYFMEGFGKGITSGVKTRTGFLYSFNGEEVEYANLKYRQIVFIQKNGQKTEEYVKDFYPVVELREKWHDLAKATGVSCDLIYYAFKTAIDYIGDNNKDDDYWCDVMYERCARAKAEQLLASEWDIAPDRADEIKKMMAEDFDFADMDEETIETLKRVANGNVVKGAHVWAMKLAEDEIMKFMHARQQHPFDYALSMEDDLKKFFKIEAVFRDHVLN